MKQLLFSLALLLQNCQSAKQPPSVPSSSGADSVFPTLLAQGRDVLVENQTIDAPLDFLTALPTCSVAPGVLRAEAAGSVTFVKCHFRARVSAFGNMPNGAVTTVVFGKNLTFLDCTFDDEVSFRGCVVRDLACFSGCTFVKKANFESADFADEALFSDCKFQAEARFQNTFFRKKANFMHTEFSQSVNFQGAAFSLDAQFGDLRSYTSADFSTAQFGGHAFFNYAEWNGRAMFDDVWFKGRCEFLTGKFVAVSMKNAWFLGQPRFDEAKIDISLDLSGCHWSGGIPSMNGVVRKKVLNFTN